MKVCFGLFVFLVLGSAGEARGQDARAFERTDSRRDWAAAAGPRRAGPGLGHADPRHRDAERRKALELLLAE